MATDKINSMFFSSSTSESGVCVCVCARACVRCVRACVCVCVCVHAWVYQTESSVQPQSPFIDHTLTTANASRNAIPLVLQALLGSSPVLMPPADLHSQVSWCQLSQPKEALGGELTWAVMLLGCCWWFSLPPFLSPSLPSSLPLSLPLSLSPSLPPSLHPSPSFPFHAGLDTVQGVQTVSPSLPLSLSPSLSLSLPPSIPFHASLDTVQGVQTVFLFE